VRDSHQKGLKMAMKKKEVQAWIKTLDKDNEFRKGHMNLTQRNKLLAIKVSRREAKDNMLLQCSRLRDYMKVIDRINPEIIYSMKDDDSSQEYLVKAVYYDDGFKGDDRCGITFKLLAIKTKSPFQDIDGTIAVSYEDIHQKEYIFKKVRVENLPLFVHFEEKSPEFERLVKE
jgi:hypothetical protein